jgi:predicted permease
VKAMKGDEELASSIIVISTLLSVVSLSLVLAHAVPL